MIRPARDSDAAGFIALIGACWTEFPGCILDVDGEVPELRALATHFAEAGGALWTAERDGRVIGMIGVRPLREDAAWEICRMYLVYRTRLSGHGTALCGAPEVRVEPCGA
ncbi:MAG: GNAT family N-acetyltransferase, partial [Acetobacteraceae bacterium]|nr:GNAT family N-acetyltransferase [Acetobacteraceae bacterium]